MLKEVTKASQNEKGILRRIFIDDFFELFVWYYKPELKIKGFQLCYDVQDNEHAVTWLDDKGFAHNKIDTGKRKNQTAVGMDGKMFEWKLRFKKQQHGKLP